ncbi:hypothetical protein ACH5RR_033925 [Cinchona calisaya]|uniref:Uncharacterized protein n=1 Tax=Cinchona calisaya TaxID=153742 RepID=A0ABD2YD72_9GENT
MVESTLMDTGYVMLGDISMVGHVEERTKFMGERDKLLTGSKEDDGNCSDGKTIVVDGCTLYKSGKEGMTMEGMGGEVWRIVVGIEGKALEKRKGVIESLEQILEPKIEAMAEALEKKPIDN